MHFAAFVSAHYHGCRQEIDQMAYCSPPAPDRESFQDFGDEDKQGDDGSRENFTDRQGSHNSDGHGELHCHPALNEAAGSNEKGTQWFGEITEFGAISGSRIMGDSIQGRGRMAAP